MATAINNFMLSNEGDHDDQEDGLRGGFQNRGLESPSFYTPHPKNFQVFENSTRPVFYTFLENQLIESVKASLNHELYANATFLCERLYGQVQNEDVKYLLAQCY